MKILSNILFFFIAALMSFSCWATFYDFIFCPTYWEPAARSETEPFSVSFDIPELLATDGTVINDPVSFSFTRIGCLGGVGMVPYRQVDLHATVSPEIPGRSAISTYKYKISQNRVNYIDLLTLPEKDLRQPRVYSVPNRGGTFNFFDASFTLTISRDCSLSPSEPLGCIDDPQWKVFDFPNFGESDPTGGDDVFNVTGFWYDPSLSGSGFNFAQIRGKTHLYYYGYTQAGQRLWLISDGGKVLQKGQTQTYNMLEIKDGTFDQPSRNLQSWGTLDLKLVDCGGGRAILAGIDGTQTHNLKLLGSVDGTRCSGRVNSDNNGTFNITGFWYDPSLSGSGFNFAQIRGETHLYYYGYTKAGQRLWLISDGGKMLQRGQTQTYNMLEIKDGTFDQPSQNLQSWGALDLTPTSCGEGQAVLNGIDGIKHFDLKLLGKVDDTMCQ